MKPEQFIRDFGEKKAREVIAKDQFVADLCLITPSGKLIYYKKVKGSFPEVTDFGKVELDADDYFMLELSDLKRLVESVELVEVCGGLVEAKKKMNSESLRSATIEYVLYKAIRDHESIYGGGDE